MISQADIEDLMPASCSTSPWPTVLQSAQSYVNAHPKVTVRYRSGRNNDTGEFDPPVIIQPGSGAAHS